MPDKWYELEGFPRWIEHDWMKWYDLSRSYRRAVESLISVELPDRDWYSERDILPTLHLLHFYTELVFKCLLVKLNRESCRVSPWRHGAQKDEKKRKPAKSTSRANSQPTKELAEGRQWTKKDEKPRRRLPVSQPSPTQGRHLTQLQDSQALRLCEHAFSDERADLPAPSGPSGCLD